VIRLLINGARGRMGASVRALAANDPRFAVVAQLDQDTPDDAVTGDVDVIVDFSTDAGARRAAELAQRLESAVLVGTTGLSDASLHAVHEAANTVPVMLAANTSAGVAVMRFLVAHAARLLGDDYDVDLVEYHHRGKRDAPSGTAARLINAIEAEAGPKKNLKNVHSGRLGDIVGEHSVRFAGAGEYLEITHRATTRDLFAIGALRAAAWLVGRAPGRYTIEQALGLEPAD